MDFNERLKELSKLQENVEAMVDIQNDFYSKMDAETYAQVKEHHEDINKVVDLFKKGDFNSLQTLLNKYTNK